MFKTVAIPILFAVMSILFSLACIGEKETKNKTLYAVVAGALFVLLLIGDKLL